jgi:hypothetical protein
MIRWLAHLGLMVAFIAVILAPRSIVATTIADKVDFNSQIRPILSGKCFHCHGPDEKSRKAKLRLDLREEATRERDEIIPIKPGDLANSEMIRRITAGNDSDDLMPPAKAGHPLTPGEIGLLKKWVQQGAPYAKHWSFVKPQRPELPGVSRRSWPKNQIDFCILAKLEANKLKPSASADRFALIRRVSLDLIGLPPTPAEVEAFVKDKSSNAFEKVVDRLLGSPAYGEKWARMWLDIARYADSYGYGQDSLRQNNPWPYRDWVIDAFNRNMPFDQFTIEQLAGDLLEGPTEEQLIATAFHRNTMTNVEGGTDDEEWRVAAVKDRANVTAQAWMGLTMGCAQCHSHKFDPISQKEYYQFYAFFNQTEDNDQADERPTIPLGPAEKQKQAEELEAQIAALEKAVAEQKEETNNVAKTKKQIAQLKKKLEADKPPRLPVMRDFPSDKQRVTHLLNKGNFLDPGDEVSAAIPASFNAWPAGAPTNRLGVAKWLMSPENPLTARVVANRFWAQLFGVGIVETEEDFGTQGSLPTHPELLDWLACELRDGGWDVKKILKTIVMSATYQQSSRVTPESLAKDPRNRLLSRSPRRRLEAETIRDQALALSGLLSDKIGGPSVYPPQPDGLWKVAFDGKRDYPTSTGEDRYRRGLYTVWRRTVPYPSMTTFDAPSRETCTFRRLPTNTPLQAYVTLNDPVYVEAAQALGRRIVREGGRTVESRITFGLKLVLSRRPTKTQVAALKNLFESELAHYRRAEKDALQLATEPLGKLPDGMNAAEAAAWTVVANVLLNLDGVLMKG